ncbi:efflux transporter periplasmic adaptor subunit [Arachidicoccus ginsenosidimutans]|uniref:efflux RND transporter periplasmic adaptor subunit n=1 Tax=Arachidicoccus sp. BS20 TaxID=1850526 RepID=UPI0007F0EE45|nr:efflux RND transporter periplasmic adaptor subunit [Arachidicoccus sp. BS20]ANI87865.1 efflux transporter periplasmic adaptor subunit [Arachidicoccus sp. BS20]
MKKLIPVSFIICMLVSCSSNLKQRKKSVTPTDYPVLTLTPRNATTYTDYPATVQGEQVVEIRPKVDGYLENILIPEGATVHQGELLFQISNPQFEQDKITAEAAIKSAEANVAAARMNVEKVKPLVEKDIVSKYELDAAQYTLQSQQASLAQARASLANAETNIGYTQIRSPHDGVIGLIPYKIGALVSSTTASPLTTLSSAGNVFAYYTMTEKQLLDFYKLMPGKTISDKLQHIPPVSLILANGSEYQHKGKLEPASGLISTSTGTANFKATFPNPEGLIPSGASATVRVPRYFDSALIIPQSATFQIQDKIVTYVLNDSSKVVTKTIGVSPTMDGQFYIVTEGLKVGDKIVLGATNLKDGFEVKPLPLNVDSLYSSVDTTNSNR